SILRSIQMIRLKFAMYSFLALWLAVLAQGQEKGQIKSITDPDNVDLGDNIVCTLSPLRQQQLREKEMALLLQDTMLNWRKSKGMAPAASDIQKSTTIAENASRSMMSRNQFPLQLSNDLNAWTGDASEAAKLEEQMLQAGARFEALPPSEKTLVCSESILSPEEASDVFGK